jgi:hypothetical protein
MTPGNQPQLDEDQQAEVELAVQEADASEFASATEVDDLWRKHDASSSTG